MDEIKRSNNLTKYLKVTGLLSDYFSPEIEEELEEEKCRIDEKITTQKYAYVVIKGKYYESFLDGLKQFNGVMGSSIANTRELERHIVDILPVAKLNLRNQFREMLKSIITVDDKPISFGGKSQNNAPTFVTPSKRDLVAECAYMLNDNKIMEVNPTLKSHKEILRLNERYFAKIVK